MRKEEAVALIYEHKNRKIINPVELLHWTWLYVIVSNLSDEAWEAALEKGMEVLSK